MASGTRLTLLILYLIVLLMFVLPFPLSAMEPMAEAEMEAVTAGGFSGFSWDNGTATAKFDIEVRTWTEIDRFHAGPDPNGDQIWTGVALGTQSTDLVLRGFVFEARFADFDDMEQRELLGLKVGFENVSGTVSGNFQSLSRENHGYQTSPGQGSYTFDGDPLIFHINTEGANPGIWVDFGGATFESG